MTNPYVPLLIMSAAALVLAFGAWAPPPSWAPPRSPQPRPTTTSAVSTDQRSPHRGRFPVRYYLVAMTFIIFDIEVVFMYRGPSASTSWACSDWSFCMSFLVTLCVPYAYEWRRGGLDY